MTDTLAVLFHRSLAPYEAGDVAGFLPARALDLIERGIATRIDTTVASASIDRFTAMDRAALLAFGRDTLGMTDDPPAEVTDEALRTALRNSSVARSTATEPEAAADGEKSGKVTKPK